MSKPIINGIDVSECPCKDDDKCLEVPILNEYGDLIDYQDCEPQTLCPYRSKIKIQRLQEENEELKEKCKKYSEINEQEIRHYVILTNENKQLTKVCQEYKDRYCELYENADQLTNKTYKYKQALEEISRYCEEQNLKADYTACEILTIIDKVLYEN